MTETKMTAEQLVEKYQCPGCVAGPDPATCPAYQPSDQPGQIGCRGHVPGTSIGHPDNRVMLGLPAGFNKVGALQRGADPTPVRIWREGAEVGWDHLNVPVWAMDHEGDLLVRTFLPRLNVGFVDVLAGGAGRPWPRTETGLVTDVAAFVDSID